MVKDVHVEGGAAPGDLVADAAEADDPDGLVVDLRSWQSLSDSTFWGVTCNVDVWSFF